MTIIISHPIRVGWLLLACWTSASQAEELTLRQSLTAAEGYSAELSANRHQVNALQNMADSAMQLPDPKLKFGIENVPVQGGNAQRFTREGVTMGRIGIMQDYVSGTKRQRKADTLRAEASQTDAGSATIRARLQQQTAQAWLVLALSRQTLRDAVALVTESEHQIATQRGRRWNACERRAGCQVDTAEYAGSHQRGEARRGAAGRDGRSGAPDATDRPACNGYGWGDAAL